MDTQATTEQATRPTLAAVAAMAGVSVSTASLAFSGAGPVAPETKKRVLAAARTLNYGGPDPRARSLRQGRSGIIAVVMEDRLRDAFRDPMNIALLDGIATEAGGGVGLLLLTDTGAEESDISIAPMDAVVLVGCSTRLDESVATLRQRNVPIVAVEAAPMSGVLAVDLDNREASATAARHLRQLGHKNVAIVTLPLDASGKRGLLTDEIEAHSTGFTAAERLRGAREVYPHSGGYVSRGSTIDEGILAGRALLAADPPTAIIAQSDMLAIGVIRAAEELGMRVPEDLSVVGFDGARIDGSAPYVLTTLVQPAVEKGQAAGRAVMQILAGEHPLPVSLTSTFREGNTTAAPR